MNIVFYLRFILGIAVISLHDGKVYDKGLLIFEKDSRILQQRITNFVPGF